MDVVVEGTLSTPDTSYTAHMGPQGPAKELA